MIEQVLSVVAALMILVAYAGQQMNKLRADGFLYIILNLTGSVILAIIAFQIRQLGLTLLEGSWAAITLISLMKTLKVERT